MELAEIKAEGSEDAEKEIVESIKAAKERKSIFKSRDDYK